MARRAQNALSLVSLVRKAALWFLQTQGAPFQNHRVAFPQVPDSLLIFGAGHGFEVLTQAAWLTSCQVYYWVTSIPMASRSWISRALTCRMCFPF
jgi:hypothetical protein